MATAQAKMDTSAKARTTLIRYDNAEAKGLDFLAINAIAFEAGLIDDPASEDNVYVLRFHEETEQVDLSTLDGTIVIVDIELLGDVPRNDDRE